MTTMPTTSPSTRDAHQRRLDLRPAPSREATAGPRSLRRVGILGTGGFVPERVLTNADLERLVETSDEWIRTRTGMRERRIAGPGEATSDLAAAAARRALAHC